MQNSWHSKALSLLLALLLAAPQLVLAQSIPGIGGGGNLVPTDVQKTVLSPPTAGILKATTALDTKENILDGILYGIEKMLLRSITQSIVDWINSGFQGNPAFVTDLEGFLLDVADKAAGAYIFGSDLAFLCSPFKLQIQISLLTSRSRERVKCRLTTVVSNIEGFLTDSNVRLTTLEQWSTLTMDPFSNPYGTYVMTQAALDARISGAGFLEKAKLDFGRGFLSFSQEKNCQVFPSQQAPSANTGTSVTEIGDGSSVRVCDIVTQTPGAVIEEQLNNTLGSGQRQLELADEIDEIISALMGQIAKQALTGAQGLFGLSSSGTGGRSSYTSRLGSATTVSTDQVLSSTRTALRANIQASIAIEQDYQAVQGFSLAVLSNSTRLIENVISCYNNKIQSGLLSDSDLSVANDRIIAASGTLAALTPTLTALKDAITRADTNIALLQQLDSVAASTNDPTTLNQVANQYAGLLSGHFIHTQADVADAQQASADIQSTTSALDPTTVQQLNECQAFPPTP
ncbi:hypothetical protein A2761_02600 [Candidatus Kaiserbacteria bacterium RIFCSPHIGHO2_01_FULL_51_33]|uniref:Flagellin N-terminal domain-containing protein n=1 Tax=Candidatus Kaiserbacteria bacterium RIFCSPLOWO2_01_FULL_51_21 TaxID=1798508 RepID=A0A1F6EDB7_9BACT|nr:MAG: hypothetical protein A2761_02600 [Candidatus Kaiserbacteria bacterium RIFCSPHIGHO2_01_FULL_51_33]OGG71668.1 MAG: hypothetical protein A3A35_00690 [Candidatus Kaiserbacteria bacterium RIFCSPLOWO2_01_FULL_51_21]